MGRLGVSRRASGLALIIAAASLAAVGSSAVLSATSAAADDSGYTASFIPTGQQEFASAINPATDTVYLGARATDYLTALDGTTGTVTATLNLGAVPRGIAVDPQTDTVYVTLLSSSGPDGIDIIDGATNSITDTISQPAGSDPAGIAVNSATDTLYEVISGQVDVLNGTTGSTIATVRLGSATAPYAITFDQASDVAWVASESGYAVAISGASDSVMHTISLPGSFPISIAVNPTTNTVYAATQSGTVAVVDGATGTLAGTIVAPDVVRGVAVNPVTGTIYIAGLNSQGYEGSTWVVSGTTIVDTTDRGGYAAAVDPVTGAVYTPAVGVNGAFVFTSSASDGMSPIINGNPLATFAVGVAGSSTINTSALPAAAFTESGELPAGITLSSSGVLSGTPATGSGGAYPITVTASNGIVSDYQESFTVVVDQVPQFTGSPTATFQVGTAGSYPIGVSGYPAATVQASGQVPSGLTVTDNSPGGWALSGTPLPGSGGVYDTEFYGGNSFAGAQDLDVTITVNEAPEITSSSHVTFRTDQLGNVIFHGRGYPYPVYSLAGKLPAGVRYQDGVLSGTPAAHTGGTYPLVVTAVNSIGSATQAFTLTVDQAPAFTSAASTTFKASSKHTFTFRTSGYPAAKLSRSGSLLKGVTFKAGSNGTATLTGNPPRADRGKTYVLKITASNGVGGAIHQTFHLKIS